MIQVGIFTAYFPYGLEETAKRIRSHGFNTVQLDLHFKDMDLSPGQITREKCTRIRETFRDANLPISAISGYTNILHPDLAERTRRVDALKEILKSARARHSVRDLRDWHLQPHERLGLAPEEQDARGVRRVPQGDRRARAVRLRPRRGVPARDLREQRDRLGRGDAEALRRRRSPRPRPAHGSHQLLRGAQHRSHEARCSIRSSTPSPTRSASATPRT